MLIAADKPYGLTGDGKLVKPTHPLCRQIIAHAAGQEVPYNLLQAAGLLDKDEKTLVPRNYDDVPLPAEAKEPAASAPSSAPTQKAIDKAVAEALEKQKTELDSDIDKKIADAVAAALKAAAKP